MAKEKDLKRRIDSVKNVRQITRTMKAVASARLNRAQERIMEARPYSREIEKTIRSILNRHPDIDHPYLYRPGDDEDEIPEDEDTHPVYLVLTGDRGLCGSFNSNVQKRVDRLIEENPTARLFVIGKRGVRYFQRDGAEIVEPYVDFWDSMDYGDAVRITNDLVDEFELEETTSITLVYNEFESAMVQHVVEYPLLPLNREDFYVPEGDPRTTIDYLYEPDPESVIDSIFPQHIQTQVWTSLLESYASEQGARMVAMDNATENANEMIEDLTLEYNKARQQTITREIAEIVGGAEALEEG